MEAAREEARQKASEGIRTAGEKDWRELSEWLKLTFPEYRQGNSINVTATANAQQAPVVVTEEQWQRLVDVFTNRSKTLREMKNALALGPKRA
jgi:hypothetical protein